MAGPSLQQECSAKGPVNAGDMAVTGGGKLKCKHVFHVVCDGWNDGKGEQVKCLRHLCSSFLLLPGSFLWLR